jgi:beta-N-acetylhexosaminidase
MVLFATLLLTASPEEIVQQMTLPEKIGQLFVVPACPERGEDHLADLQLLIEKYHIGGILLKQGDQASYRELYEKLGKEPLLHFGDAEWGVSMRMKDAVRFPKNLTLGAVQDLSLIKEFGIALGKECAQVGIHINLAPVADINTNPRNPVIGMRSFGDDAAQVSLRTNIVVDAVQAENVGATVKHYPGHGDTAVDSHIDLPVVQEMQLEPFKQAIAHHVRGVLTAHLLYEPTQEIVTFSYDLIEKKLREELGFEGLIITDGLSMAALTKYFPADEIALKALQAGHDILLYGDHRPEFVDKIVRLDVPAAIQAIEKAVIEKRLDEKTLDRHVVRILQTKKDLIREIPPSQPLSSPESLALKKRLFDQAVTLVSNRHIPLQEGTNLSLIQFGSPSENLSRLFSSYLSANDVAGLRVVAIYNMTPEAKEYLQREMPEIVILFTSPYKLIEINLAPTTIVAYERDRDAEEAVINILFGKQLAFGKLPIKL